MLEDPAMTTTTLGIRALIQLLLATADIFFVLNIWSVLKHIKQFEKELANKTKFALYPWLVILPIHATACLWNFLLYIGAMLGEPVGTVF